MTVVRSSLRPLLSGIVVAALLTQGGCVYLRAKFGNSAIYEDAVQSRPLEVPPGLDMPSTAGATTIPDVGPGAEAAAAAAEAEFAAAQAPGRPATAAAQDAGAIAVAGVDSFMVADGIENTWRRVGIALGKIDGVTVGESSQLLHGHEVTFQGVTMLVRVEEAGGQSRVVALGADGQPLRSGPATQLLGLLKERLG